VTTHVREPGIILVKHKAFKKMKQLNHPSGWKYASPEEEGFHEIVTPENSACRVTWIYRLNLSAHQDFLFRHEDLEMNGVVIKGSVNIIRSSDHLGLERLDAFYLPSGEDITIVARQDCAIYIGGSICEKKGRFFTRKYDLSLPLGEIHQVHGKPPYRREVFMTLAQQDAGSRLICGITRGDPGQWTSWPPHQHTDDLEEVYCYFDIPRPRSAFHLSSRKMGEFEYIHPVSTGDCVIIPEGYHPTCGMPGVSSCYFWVMAAHRPESRRYDLAVNDPNFE
jgi:5-deoxy-glucuronate isomerase